MKGKDYILLFTLLLIFNSCYEDPMGVGLADRIPPKVELLEPLEQSEFNDADLKVEYSIYAKDFWGISEYYIVVNDQQVQSKDLIGGNGFSTSILKEGDNQVYAVVFDTYGNRGKSNVANISFVKTIKVVNIVSKIDLLDIDSVYTLNLNTIFKDLFDSSSKFEFTRTVENYTGSWNTFVTDSILTINTFKYFSGSGTIVITAAKSDGRSATIEIPVIIKTSEMYNRIYIPDYNFRHILKRFYNFTIDREYVFEKEVLRIDSLNLHYMYKIENFEGLQYFTNLTYLNISGHKVKNIDFTNLYKINKLECNGCEFVENFDLSPLIELEELSALFNYSYLTLDVSNNLNLKKLSLSSNRETIDLSNNTKLEHLYFEGMQRIDLSKNIDLKKIQILESQVEEIDLTYNIELEEVDFTRTSLSELDLRNNQKLISIKLNDNFQLIKTIVWELPLPNYIYVEKDEQNIFFTEP